MKLEFHGHDERYVVEQSLMNLFPGELPVYEPIASGDDAWARITCDEAEDYLVVTADLFFHGRSGVYTCGAPLSGTDFDREGQRRHAVGACGVEAGRVKAVGLAGQQHGVQTRRLQPGADLVKVIHENSSLFSRLRPGRTL